MGRVNKRVSRATYSIEVIAFMCCVILQDVNWIWLWTCFRASRPLMFYIIAKNLWVVPLVLLIVFHIIKNQDLHKLVSLTKQHRFASKYQVKARTGFCWRHQVGPLFMNVLAVGKQVWCDMIEGTIIGDEFYCHRHRFVEHEIQLTVRTSKATFNYDYRFVPRINTW